MAGLAVANTSINLIPEYFALKLEGNLYLDEEKGAILSNKPLYHYLKIVLNHVSMLHCSQIGLLHYSLLLTNCEFSNFLRLYYNTSCSVVCKRRRKVPIPTDVELTSPSL